MSYSVEELFSFWENEGEYAVSEFLKDDDPTVTEINIPAEYRGKPVTRISSYCFFGAQYLKRVVIPPSVRVIGDSAFCYCYSLETAEFSEGLEEIERGAFEGTGLKSIVFPKSLKILFSESFSLCEKLESVVFNSSPSIGERAFYCCSNLPADITLMGLVNSCDISKPLDDSTFDTAFDDEFSHTLLRKERRKYTRPDVFELAVKNDCFRSVDVFVMLRFLFIKGHTESLRFVMENGLLKSRKQIEEWIERSAEEGLTELTAYLLELKKRKFGFKGGGDFEL